MAQLAANLQRTYVLGDEAEYPASTGAVYEGSAVGLTSGYARQLVAGDPFVGFAVQGCPASGANGTNTVTVKLEGRVIVPISGIALTNVNAPVYASDGNTFTLTQSTNTLIGKVVRVAGTNLAEVEFKAGA
jgi:predicted RecA/RadA family phage recombinase